jgi:glycosyltransferase involved in cell wall biosynthesis
MQASNAILIIPALNEELSIGTMLSLIPAGLYRAVIVADNGSTDRTAEVARAHGAIVVSEPQRGYGAACLRALQSLPEGAEIAVFMQADASEDANEARNLIDPIAAGRADFVIGSRTLGNAAPGALLPHQVFGNHVACFLIRLFWGYRFTDLGPYRAISIPALEQLHMRDRNYGWTVEMQVKAVQRRLRIEEVPVSYGLRIAGENKVSGNWKASVSAGLKIIWTVLRAAFRS